MARMKHKSKRMIKSPAEISKLKKAAKLTENAIEHGLSVFERGMSEKELAKKMRKWVRDRGLHYGFLIVQGDANSANIHGRPTDHKIKRCLLIDAGVVYKGYHGDTTRTYLLKPDKKMKKTYSIVKKAYERSVAGIRPGVECKKVDAIARNFIKKSGHRFKHSLGHGVGLNVHEYPNISPKSKQVFENNTVFTIEPGIYLKGRFGIRIENTLLLKNRVHSLNKLKIPDYA